MKKSLKLPTIYIIVVASLVSIVVLILHVQRSRQPWEDFKAPDDVMVARETLAHRFTGPRYFQYSQDASEPLPYPYIATSQASSQIEGIRKARALQPDAAAKINNLISQLSIRPSSRLTGVYRVNFLQLNLALDEMR